jgi:hypothetical protein
MWVQEDQFIGDKIDESGMDKVMNIFRVDL